MFCIDRLKAILWLIVAGQAAVFMGPWTLVDMMVGIFQGEENQSWDPLIYSEFLNLQGDQSRKVD